MINKKYPGFNLLECISKAEVCCHWLCACIPYFRVDVPQFLQEKSVYGMCFARVFTETLGILSMLCQIVYCNTLYINGVLPEYLLKHSVYWRCCAR
jgi:hypothetical protein